MDGDEYLLADRTAQAIRSYQRALDALKSIEPNGPRTATVNWRIGTAYLKAADTAKATEYLTKSISTFEKCHKPERWVQYQHGLALSDLGSACEQSGKPEQSAKLYRRAVETFLTADHSRASIDSDAALKRQLVRCYSAIAKIERALGHTEEAAQSQDLAANLSTVDRAQSKDQLLAMALKKANKLKRHRNFFEAIETLDPLIDRKQLGSSLKQQEALTLIASCQNSMRNYTDARSNAEEILKAQRETQAPTSELIATLRNLGKYCQRGRQPDEAAAYYLEAIKLNLINSELGPQDVADMHFGLGKSLHDKAQYKPAIREFRIALKLAQDVNDQDMILDIKERLKRSEAATQPSSL